MGCVPVRRAALARLGVLLGGLLFTVGVWLAIDVAAGLMTGGIVFAMWCLFLADVDPAEGGGKEGRP